MLEEHGLNAHWYVLQNKYQKENSLYRVLVDKGFEVFYPRLRVNPVNPRSQKERPYFPGYMFVFTDLTKVNIKTFQRMPYVIDLVNFGGRPAEVPEYVIDSLRKNLENQPEGSGIQRKFNHGESVKILKGPFTGYEGIFDKSLAGETRVRILLSLLDNKKIMLELSVSDVSKTI